MTVRSAIGIKRMAKYMVDFNTARDLHRMGDLKTAKKAYLALLKNKPRNPELLHALGILHTQEENFAKATEYLEKAVHYEPRDPSIQSHLANVYKFQGLLEKAQQLLEKTLLHFPDHIPSYNNLANIYFASEKYDLAIACYEKAIAKKPDYVDAYYNLGLTFIKKSVFSKAREIFQKILTLVPDHFAARFQLASVNMYEEKFSEAIKEFLMIENTHPHHFETQTNLASCYLKKGELKEAKKHYLQALELRKEDTQIIYNLGVISMQAGNVDAAIQYYQKLLHIQPAHFAAQNNIAVAFLAKNHLGYALQHFKEALRIDPENTAISYIVDSLAQNKHLQEAPSAYIQSLFDAYADHYEPHLLNALEYQIPQIFAKVLQPFSSNQLAILDLGAGTGLCGEVFKPFAKTMVAVDLSAKMLEIAKKKNIYDELIIDDMKNFLKNTSQQFDLIIAGDVFIYTGDLQELFRLVAKCLTSNGLFIFNTEISDTDDYKMNQSGRFSHHKNYINTVIENQHFKIRYYQTCMTRMQNHSSVPGHLYILSKATVW
jgi:predicted TPR repeat methyltransferase